MENKMKILIITNVITIILVLALGGYIIFDKISNKEVKKNDDNKIVENINNQNDQQGNNTNENNDERSYGSLFYSTLSEGHKIYLNDDNIVNLVSKTLGNKEIARNINLIREISAGQSDVCEGNTWLILQSGDTDVKYSALSVDMLSCGNEIMTLDLSAELNKRNIKNIVSIYDTKEFTNQYEPLLNRVYVLDESGKSIDITDIFIDNEE